MRSYYYYDDLYEFGQDGGILAVAFLVSIVAGIVLFFTFLNKKNEYKFSGFIGWLYDVLSFNKLMIDSLLKIFYLIAACFMTIGGFFAMFSSFLIGLFMIVFGNIFIRICYEFLMLLIITCQNTSEINKKLGGSMSSKEFVTNFGIADKETVSQPVQSQPYHQNTAPAPTPPVYSSISNVTLNKAEPPATTIPSPNSENPVAKNCTKCGVVLSPDAIFCYNCGQKL